MSAPAITDETGVLQAVAQTASELLLEVMVVGASARDLLLESARLGIQPRRTFDVDIAAKVPDWDTYNLLVGRLQAEYGCRLDPHFEGRLLFAGAPSLDLVPFGGIADAEGNISWPPDHDVQMGTAGFGAVLQSSVEINTGVSTIRVASFAGIVLLKLLAWHDRSQRTDDLRDVWFIFDHYTDLIDQGRLYADHGIDADVLEGDNGFDWTEAGARLVGRDVRRQTGETGISLLSWLDLARPDLQDRIVGALTSVVECSDQRAIDAMRSFRSGLDEEDPVAGVGSP